MDRINFTIKMILSVLILLAAIVQWIVLIERGWSAGWMWYKFQGYGGSVPITVGRESQALFYIMSCILASVGFWLSRFAEADHKVAYFLIRMSRYGSISLMVGMICWTVLLLSPLVVFR